jgi:hypothetical protein
MSRLLFMLMFLLKIAACDGSRHTLLTCWILSW